MKVRRGLLNDFGIEIGGGLGDLQGKIWRVGLMGHSSTRKNVLLFVTALETVLKAQGIKVSSGALEAVSADGSYASLLTAIPCMTVSLRPTL
ncbi:MAG: hypothetical protein JRF50_13020 [Deltaproteobacteria bacterium]|nr:hypothetical protein [Deltaproteobacteria bacterium]